MEKNKMYDVPVELQDIMGEIVAMCKLRDALVKQPFRLKKAKQCAIRAEQLRYKFWREIHLLYPKLKGEVLEYKTDYLVIVNEA